MRPLWLHCFPSPRRGEFSFPSSTLSPPTTRDCSDPTAFSSRLFSQVSLLQNQYQALPNEMLLSRGSGPHLRRHNTTEIATCWEGTLALHIDQQYRLTGVGAVHALATEAKAPRPHVASGGMPGLDFCVGNTSTRHHRPRWSRPAGRSSLLAYLLLLEGKQRREGWWRSMLTKSVREGPLPAPFTGPLQIVYAAL